ncbi:MAG: glycine--tRNA ligase subunit beta [Burkholderia sp.]|nr:glycine--tRNA ligase subunit beta [Burkholderia sp.]
MKHKQSAPLLIELLTEELPPKTLSYLSDAFCEGLTRRLASLDLIDGKPLFNCYATPRRLAVIIQNVRIISPKKRVREKILPVSIALNDDGKPTAILIKKLELLGLTDITIEKLDRVQVNKTESLFVNYLIEGTTLEFGLQKALNETLFKLPIHKAMRYQRSDGSEAHFVRPVHRLISLHNDRVVPISVLGLNADRITIGHRFLSTGLIRIQHVNDYVHKLNNEAYVIANFIDRKELIRKKLTQNANGYQVMAPDLLLNEVTSLVEWPVIYSCNFDKTFLDIPQECLILIMQVNRKYFPLTNVIGKLQSRFLIVSNIETDKPQEIIEGNERVLRSYLTDAKFFFNKDKMKSLAERVHLLENVVYHNKLGSQLERVKRVEELAGKIAKKINADEAITRRAAWLAKADLLTDMVKEFPELQGTMGGYYALHDGEHEDIVISCSEHYKPCFSGDSLTTRPVSTAVALAYKLETIIGIWGIGLAPTGEKDPFALRRHALGVLRLLVEKKLPLDLIELLRNTYNIFLGVHTVVESTVAIHSFFIDRLHGLLRNRGYSVREIDAVLSHSPTRVDNIIEQLDSVHRFTQLAESETLLAVNKRISNILKKSGNLENRVIKTCLLINPAEKALADRIVKVTSLVQSQLEAHSYIGALLALVELCEPVNIFFDSVMINTEDIALRENRIALLSNIYYQMNRVADISKLIVQPKKI